MTAYPRRHGKSVRTTIPAKDVTRAGDLLNRDFTAPAPNRVWVADFTHCRAWGRLVYVAFVVDPRMRTARKPRRVTQGALCAVDETVRARVKALTGRSRVGTRLHELLSTIRYPRVA
jgi:transposase InsO family protein